MLWARLLDDMTVRTAAASRPRVNAANTMFLPLERLPLRGGYLICAFWRMILSENRSPLFGIMLAPIILAAGLL
jgi:hypothetical protein